MAGKKALLLYIPVLHKGYLDLLERHKDADLWLVGQELIDEFSPLHREIRALDPEQMATIIGQALPIQGRVFVATPRHLPNGQVVSAHDGVSDKVIAAYLPEAEVTYEPVFLKWSEDNVAKTEPAGYDRISTAEFDREMMRIAKEQAVHSSDWWRQIGGVLVKGWQPHVLGFNRHVPSPFHPYVFGDPRDFIPAGERSELSTTIHCEESLILEAAKKGIVTAGCWIYVPTFPCPRCAKLEAYSGIVKVFFTEGHASLDGQEVLKANNVELILVQ